MEESIRCVHEGPVAAEYQRRLEMWAKLKEARGPHDVHPGLLRDLRVYGGGQGIWVDKAITGSVSPDGRGVTVGLLHTGEHRNYLSADGVIYHYARTSRPLGRDLQEISATKNAGLLRLPVFVVTTAGPGKSLRDVRIGWVEDWDDAGGAFLVMFGAVEQPMACVAQDPGRLFPPAQPACDCLPHSSKRTASSTRFRFGVFRRYGYKCAVCNIAVPELLDVVSLKPNRRKADDDPTHGLVLCALHHRAYEAGLFAIDPDTLHVITPSNGPDAAALNVTRADLRHLPKAAEPQALDDTRNQH